MNEKIILDRENSLVLMNYKEPLISVEDGFGYYGAILVSQDKNFIQCHICGELHRALGRHLRNKHGMNCAKYRKEFQLAHDTALVGETTRLKLKEGMLKRLSQMTKEEREGLELKRLESVRKFNKERGGWKIALEIKNKYGTCPDQTLAKIEECKDSLGHVPSRREFKEWCGSQRYLHLCKSYFGSWTNALRQLGLESKKRVHGTVTRRTDEDLLNALKSFYDITGKIPTASDSRRLNLPDGDIYSRRFGWRRARELAGIPELKKGHKTWVKNVAATLGV